MKIIRDGKMCSLPEGGEQSLEQRLRRLEDEREIREILYHYTRCVDRGDIEGIGSCRNPVNCSL